MTGEGLYGWWASAMHSNGCEVEPFEDLDATDKKAWNEVAAKVKPDLPISSARAHIAENLYERFMQTEVIASWTLGSNNWNYLSIVGSQRGCQIAMAQIIKSLYDDSSFDSAEFHELIEDLMLMNVYREGDKVTVSFPNIQTQASSRHGQ